MGQRCWKRNLIILFFFLIPQVVCAQAITNLSVQQLEEVYDRQTLLKYIEYMKVLKKLNYVLRRLLLPDVYDNNGYMI